jgi:hypothetical protein
MPNQPKTPTPFGFDGHGINDAEGQRICKVVSCGPYLYSDGVAKRNEEFDRLSNLFAAAPEMQAALMKVAQFSGYVGGFISRPIWWTDDAAWQAWVTASEAVRQALKKVKGE